MTALRVLHTSDIHLGKRFGGYDAGPRLTEARFDTLATLARIARDGGAPHILVAGDLFETPTPAPTTLRQAMAEMAKAEGLTWWLLPGNHDNAGEAAATWDAVAAGGHAGIRVLRDAAPVEIQPGAWLLPAPVATRRPGSDPTAWLDGATTPDGAIRVGLAHGPIQGFSEDDAPPGVIAPDRAGRAGLDWLALGDWHGQMPLGPRAAYSGAPEHDRFRHDGRGACLMVAIDGPGAVPTVERVPTGRFAWHDRTLDLLPGMDPAATLAEVLPAADRRDTLLRVTARGRATLDELSALARAAAHFAPEFCRFDWSDDAVALDRDVTDLDAIAGAGALRRVAETLLAEAGDPALAEGDRRVADAALRRLHALVAGDAE